MEDYQAAIMAAAVAAQVLLVVLDHLRHKQAEQVALDQPHPFPAAQSLMRVAAAARLIKLEQAAQAVRQLAALEQTITQMALMRPLQIAAAVVVVLAALRAAPQKRAAMGQAASSS